MSTKDEALKLALEIKNSASAYWTEKEIPIIERLIELLAQPEPEPVAHCEAGSEFCPVCRAETRSLALAAAIGYVQRNTPKIVSDEICNALNHFLGVRNMVAQPEQEPSQFALPAPGHPDDAAVDRFAATMKDKLSKAREKGRSGWETCPPKDLSRMLREHVEKGDPRDVANFAMMLWNLGAGIAPQPAQQEPVAKYIGECSEGSMVQLYKDVKKGTKFYTTPPQRKELTDWIDPNDKTQKQYLPHIGKPVLFCHSGNTYCGHHNGGSFQNKDEYFNTWECRWMYLPAAHGIKD